MKFRVVIIAVAFAAVSVLVAGSAGADSVDPPADQGRACVAYLDPVGSFEKQRRDGEVEAEPVMLGCFASTDQAADATADHEIQNSELDDLTVPRRGFGRDEASPDGEDIYPRGIKLVIGEDYEDVDYAGNTLVWTARHGCTDTLGYKLDIMPYPWRSEVSSGSGFSACNRFKHFYGTFYSGATVTCDPGCHQFSALNDHVHSEKWRHN